MGDSSEIELQAIDHILVILDGITEDTVDVVQLKSFHLELFCKQFDVPIQSDPQMLDRYVVGPDDLEFLIPYLQRFVTFSFSSHGYWIEAVTR